MSPRSCARRGAVQLAADWRIFIARGRVYAVHTDEGRIVATTATLPYGSRFAWISMVLVAGEFRRRGLATRLMRWAMDDLAAARLVPLLDATPDGREVYRRLGFQDFLGLSASRSPRAATRGRDIRRGAGRAHRADRRPGLAGTVRLRRRSLRRRTQRRACRLAPATARGRARCRARRPHRGLHARARRCACRADVRPLIADDDATACALIARALDALDGPLFIDLADDKAEVFSFLEERGFAPVRPFTRMLYGTPARFDDPARTFAVVGPEFG